MSAAPGLSPLVFDPSHLRRRYILSLAVLRAARNQENEIVTVATEVDSISWPEVDPVFEHTAADAFGMGQVALLQPYQSYRQFGGSMRIESLEPACERTGTTRIEVFFKPHANIVPYMLL